MLRRLPLILALAMPLAAQGYHGFNPANIDASVRPCDDFFQFAVGKWIKHTPIPPEYTSYGVDQEIEVRTFGLLQEILEQAARQKNAPRGSESQQVGDLFASGMDVASVEKAGLGPLKPTLAIISGVKDAKGLAPALAHLHETVSGGGFGFYVGQDDKESTQYISQISQDGLGLPDRDYYTKPDAASQKIRAQYLDHVAAMFRLMGEDARTAKNHAQIVLKLETRLAEASLTRLELRDPQANYHKMSVQELHRIAPGFDWAIYLDRIGAKVDTVVVRQPLFCKAFAAMATSVPADDWQAYLRWHAVSGASSFLSASFDQEHFRFYGMTLRGAREQKPRWKRVLAVTDGLLGEALGKLYVEKAFRPQAKARMLELVGNLKLALGERIKHLEWMSEPTKQKALHKLATMRVKIGYPDVWRDYSALEIDRGSYYSNVQRGARFEFQRRLAKLGKPIDRNEWEMTPATNNAYYSPNMNEICFPAGILQPPYFDMEADDAVNYGNIGATIGHEMTHGFDDEGRQFDADGNLKEWWSPEDAKAYATRTDLMVKQYEAFQPLPGMTINGRMTLGENIADLGGLKVAWDAWKLSLKGKPAPAPVDGFTPEQRFFLGYAETWRTQLRDEELRNRLITDVHSPAKYRVIAPLANLPEFYKAFGCAEGTTMVRPEKERPSIW